MSKNSSINGNKHPYMRLEAWTHGIQGNPPLAETWLKRTTKSIGKDISPSEWMQSWIEEQERHDKSPRLDQIKRRFA